MIEGKDGKTMVKRIILGTLLVGLIGVLVAGAIIRTVDKTENVAEARGQGRGQAVGQVGEYVAAGQGQGRGYNGQGGGNGWFAGENERQYPNYETVPEDWTAYEGTVLAASEAGGDLVIMTDEGQEVTVGTGPGYMEAQGFSLQDGERVQVQGYWEDDELKAAQVTRLSDGQTIALRDQYGRPAWSGSGRRAVAQPAEAAVGGRGQGGQGQGGAGAEVAGAGQAKVDAWLTLHGTVESVDEASLVVQTAEGEQVVVENRPWWFAQEQGFSARVGDEVSLLGFYEGDEFEVGRLDNLSAGLTIPIREENGRPLWAGRGRRGGGG
jgi:hypothetical protein